MSTSVRVQGFCPACGEPMLDTVRAAHGAWALHCQYVDCPDRDLASKVLADSEIEHIIEFTPTEFTIRHPLRERVGDDLFTCQVHTDHARMGWPPVNKPGRYRATKTNDDYVYELLSDDVAER